MPSYKNIPKDTVLQAIKGSYGITSTVARHLGCDWKTAEALINRWEETKEARRAESEVVLDIAESQVIKAIHEKDIATTKWYLSKKGKARGYEDTPTIRLENQDPLNIKFTETTAEELKSAGNVEVSNGEEESDS